MIPQLRPLIHKVNPQQPQQIIPPETPEVKDEKCDMDFSYFDKSKPVLQSSPYTEEKKTRTRKTKTLSSGDVVVTDTDGDLPKTQTNEPYADSYNETNNMLKTSVVQIDILNSDIKQELDVIKGSKTLKGKYNYIAELTGTSSALLGTKISAIREMNKTITDCHNLELRRIKELKLGETEKDDDKTMMDMYNAFISTPMGAYNPLGPSLTDISMPGNLNIVRTDITDSNGDTGYSNYINNMTPEQNRMRMERNPNIQTVVMYDQGTGSRQFEIIDRTTGQPIPNMPKPADFILEDLYINPRSGTARNANMNVEYPLVVVGQVENLDEY
jgi:hypothetical protein